MSLWGILDEAERLQWECTPFESVGPLCFGMSKTEAEAGAAGALEFWARRPQRDGVISWTASLEPCGRGPRRYAADLYFTPSDELFCVAINGRFGPQVTMGGVRLVGRVPSELEVEFGAYCDRVDGGLRYSISADPAAKALGVVLCAQRAGGCGRQPAGVRRPEMGRHVLG